MKQVKNLFCLMLIASLLICLTACSNTDNSDPNDDGQDEAGSQTYDLVYATNGSGTGNYTVAAAQGSIVTSETGNVNVTVMATTGPEGIVAAIKEGSAQIGIMSSGNFRMLYGDGCDQAMRAMFCGGATMFGFVTTADSGIKTIADMKGKRVTYISTSSTYVLAAEAIFEGNGIDPETDIVALSMTDAASGLQDLVDGKTDVVMSAISGSKMEELASKCTPYVIPVSNYEACAEASDGFFTAFDVSKEFVGAELGQPIIATISQTSVTTDTPAEAVYLFVKTCMENYDALSAVGSDLIDWKPEVAVSTAAGYPYHEGAVQYFKEAGMWSDEMEAWQAEALAALGMEK